jgi:acyl-CoA synthetase (AMP-forming)/AMP-acid ligase II
VFITGVSFSDQSNLVSDKSSPKKNSENKNQNSLSSKPKFLIKFLYKLVDGLQMEVRQLSEGGSGGEVLFKGGGVFRGYFGEGSEEYNHDRFTSDGWYMTKDVVEQVSPGLYKYVGRCDSLTTIGGKFVSLVAVERNIQDAIGEGCKEVAISAVCGTGQGKRSVWICLSLPLSMRRLIEVARSALPRHPVVDTHIVQPFACKAASKPNLAQAKFGSSPSCHAPLVSAGRLQQHHHRPSAVQGGPVSAPRRYTSPPDPPYPSWHAPHTPRPVSPHHPLPHHEGAHQPAALRE